jgi:hypothetical protein
VDLRLSKKIAVGHAKIRASLDVYNLFNVNTVLTCWLGVRSDVAEADPGTRRAWGALLA